MGERLYFEGVEGGPFESVSAAQMEKKKVLDRVLTVRNDQECVCMRLLSVYGAVSLCH